MIPAGEWFAGNHKPGDSPSDLQFLKRLFAGGFSIPRPSQNREAMFPIINHGIMLSSFYRNYRQRKNNSKVDSPMRVPRCIYNEAIPVQVPCVKDWKFMGGRDSITLNIARVRAASTKCSSPSSSTSPSTLRMQKGRRIQTPKWGTPTRRDSETIVASIWRVGYTYAPT
jgi:hypothetical protein